MTYFNDFDYFSEVKDVLEVWTAKMAEKDQRNAERDRRAKQRGK